MRTFILGPTAADKTENYKSPPFTQLTRLQQRRICSKRRSAFVGARRPRRDGVAAQAWR